MAVTTKKGSKSTKAKSRRTALKKSNSKAKQDQSLQSQLAEALEQQSVTSEILRMIARSPADLQSILDATAANAAKLCDAVDAAVWRVDGDVGRVSAHFGSCQCNNFKKTAMNSVVPRPSGAP
jgi:tryptophan 2,3-dioxygenase